jgi:multiple sugar transport system permease protein
MKEQRWNLKDLFSNSFAYVMVLPATIMLAVVSIAPLFRGVYLAFRDTNLNTGVNNFNGLANILAVIKDESFYNSFGFTLFYAFGVVVISYIFGILIALLLNSNIRGIGLFRALIVIPWVIPPIVGAITWAWILNDQNGIINVTLRNIGLIKSPILFLAGTNLVKWTTVAFGVWKSFPFMMITLLAGMKTIDSDLYEAAAIDGARNIKGFFYITLPLIKNVSLICIILMFIWTVNNYENVYLLTTGGPMNVTTNLPILTYYTAFWRGKVGYASAVNLAMLGFLLILSLVYLKILNKEND